MCHGVLLGFTGFHRVLTSFTGFCLVLPSFTRFYWVLPGFTGFYRVFFSRTRVSKTRNGCYRVLPSFGWLEMFKADVSEMEPRDTVSTEFYRVLPSFTEFPSDADRVEWLAQVVTRFFT